MTPLTDAYVPPLNPDQLAAIRERWERRYLANKKAAPLAVACADVGCLLRSHAALEAERDALRAFALGFVTDLGHTAGCLCGRPICTQRNAALEGKPRE